jgi:hypothetical protein
MASSAQLERRAERARERLTDHRRSPLSRFSGDRGRRPDRRQSQLGDEILPLIAKQARNNPVASSLSGPESDG